MTHPSEHTRSNTAEFAYTAGSKGVLTFTMLLPDLNDLQQLTESVSIDTPDLDAFEQSLTDDFRHGAVTQFFHRPIQAGRWITRVKDVHVDSVDKNLKGHRPGNRITVWCEHSSKFPTAIDTYTNSIKSTNCNDALDRSAIDHFITTTIDRVQATRGAEG